MESMIKLDGGTLLFPTSFGYFDPYMLKTAAKYKDIQFRHCGGLWQKDKHPMNTGSYFGYIGMCQYLNGIAAAHATKSRKIGFIAAKPIPQVLINVNSFAMGARAIDPAITTSVIFTGEWTMAVKEAEATNSLIGQGIDAVTCHVDGPKVIMETAERRGIYTCGYHADQSKLAPKGYLTGAEWNWITLLSGIPFGFWSENAQVHNALLVCPLFLLGIVAAIALHWCFNATRVGLRIRIVGDSQDAALALGLPIDRARFLATACGSALAGVGGAFLSLYYPGSWNEGLSSGQGLMAVALVVFSRWNPINCIYASLLFGAAGALGPSLQTVGITRGYYLFYARLIS